MKSKITGALLGLAVGDALGVPVEFQSRAALQIQPVTTMQGYGTHNQPPGTWSDDSSLAFCLAESLCTGYDLNDLAQRFINWREHGYWTPHGTVFDIGIATSRAIRRLSKVKTPTLAGGIEDEDNGNGSLMRILPLLTFIHDKPIADRYRITAEVSSLTHGHLRSTLACFIYLEMARQILLGLTKDEAFNVMQQTVNQYFTDSPPYDPDELRMYSPILENPALPSRATPLLLRADDEIRSSGYVLHTLEASLWCFLTTNSYAEAVLKAVNLGSDTDTTGCVTGGLAGLYYGVESIPADWLQVLARHSDIDDLANRLARTVDDM
ncbi:ADP-ribosylglycohydrolase family protein [Fibrella aquatilis]|uniref:ADP-ribosylglycohydrolase family protein n=1 Tax=Fibrella aquatilis TaxID=2817059 RepID=A0A939G9P1_9BACT|nr:ADP-ribosylglycohydrolase family protein [Fibrella aquatilis]MBO0934381.1 ADP-ribosylglycohydrolase family protein [Fibrella aquatilis]